MYSLPELFENAMEIKREREGDTMRYTHYLSLSNTYYNTLRRSSEELILPGSPSAIPPATPRSRTRCAKYTTSYDADRCPSSRMLSCQRLFLRHLSGSLWQFPTTALDDKDKHWHIVPNHSATAREKWRSYSSAELRCNVALSHWRDGRAYLHEDELSDQSCSLPGFDCKRLEFATTTLFPQEGAVVWCFWLKMEPQILYAIWFSQFFTHTYIYKYKSHTHIHTHINICIYI